MVETAPAADDGDRETSTRLQLLGVAALLVVPWTVLSYRTGPDTLLFAWGLVDPGSGSVTDVVSFFFVHTRGLPDWILAWGVGVTCLALALASGLGGVALDREDRRVTGGLVALVGLAVLVVSLGFSAQPGRFGVPVGTLAAWVVAGLYWRDR